VASRTWFVTLAVWAIGQGGAALVAQEARLAGYTRQAGERERALEAKILGLPSAERMNAYHVALTAEPHHAGTEANIRLADYYAQRLREFGFDSVALYRYEVLVPRPLERRISLLKPERYDLKLEEPPNPADPDTRKPGVLPPYNAYAADGDVTAEVVYVNYGMPADYRVLDSLGISVAGKIVIARYGGGWRGIKPKVAAEHGAVACIIYSDPADDGYAQGDVVPAGKWRPEWGVQRGSVMDMPLYPGDPQTPGRPSKPGAERLPLAQVPTIEKIPTIPVAWGDALPILRNLGGPVVPAAWRGALAITYHAGPGPATVRLVLKNDWGVRPIVNVVGILRGSEQPDRLVMAGGHRDAWTFGGRDPTSGAASLLETARVLAELAKGGQRPKRSIAIASWDGEEYGLLGSTEFGEDLAALLQQQLIVYLNRESYSAGAFSADGVHSLQPVVNAVAQAVRLPDDPSSVHQAWARAARPAQVLERAGAPEVRLGALGSGSDYTVFLDHLGIPSLDFGFESNNGIYHSRYDTHWFFTTFGDPGYAYGVRLAELVGVFLARMANADVLPFDYASTAETVDRYLDELEQEAKSRKLELDLSAVRAANARLAATATALDAEVDRLTRLDEAVLARSGEQVRRLNDLLVRVEQAFLSDEGLPRRPWFRHQLYAPGFYTGYGVKTLPGVREALENGDAAEARRMAGVLAAALERARALLAQAVGVAASIAPAP
jgi:N-acetylated-alpha-linked acidic dipeptidase